MSWTPKIVGGTDYGDGVEEKGTVVPIRVKPKTGVANSTQRPMSLNEPSDDENIIETTHEQLAEYSSSIPEELNPTWNYGTIQKVRDGVMVRQGQYVTEFHNGKKHQVYWVSC